ncbi:MAG: hypothetical protein NXI22_04500 [bacterium]|nr:hypothetical protein [bacterium]
MQKSLRFTALFALILSSPVFAQTDFNVAAGTGKSSRNTDSAAADEFNIGQPFGVEVGPDGALYITEVQNHRVLRLDLKTNLVTTVAGTGEKGYTGDGGLATEAQMNEPYEVRFDDAGNMFVVEMQNHIVRRIDAKTKVISTIAGDGKAGFAGDGGPATKARFHRPHSIALDGAGGLFIADIGNHRIRRIDLNSGKIETIAGTGDKKAPTDGSTAKGKPMIGPRALIVNDGVLWIALREGHSVWKMNLESGELTHVAGVGKAGYSGDGGEPKAATFNGPKGIAVDPKGRIVVVDTENHAIRRIDLAANKIETIGGKGPRKSRAIEPELMHRPHGVCVHSNGDVYVGDTVSHRVLVIPAKSTSP